MARFVIPIRRDNCRCSERNARPWKLADGHSVCLRCFRWIGHPVHVCLACSQKILPYEAERKVQSRRRVFYDTVIDGRPYGHFVPPDRYLHENGEDCQVAIRKDRWITPPWPRKHGASRAEWERKLMGG